MTPHALYKNRQANGWTRVDMLLAVYDGVIRVIDQGIAEAMSQGESVSAVSQLRAQKFLLLLLEGVDPKAGPIVENTQQLLRYCLEQVQTPTSTEWMKARKILATLREGFQDIREEAKRLEEAGEIPRLDWGLTNARLALA